MEMNDLQPIILPGIPARRPLVIAGPCSAETEEQVLAAARALAAQEVKIFRAGIWKPRTKPGGFEGVGVEGLRWLQRVKAETGMYVSTEVATERHVFEALKAGVDLLWIGARTSANPFAMQELAGALRGVDIPVLVKNPVNPDLELWIGAIERLYNAGLRRLGAIHRGFSSYDRTIYRNQPQWHIPIELRRRLPQLPLLCDPSHIGGKRELIAPLSQEAMDLGFDGLIVESHCTPDEAWSDKQQQVTPDVLCFMLHTLVVRETTQTTEPLAELRQQIDRLDDELLALMAKRMRISREIGQYKKEHSMPILQAKRYDEILNNAVHRPSSWVSTPNSSRHCCKPSTKSPSTNRSRSSTADPLPDRRKPLRSRGCSHAKTAGRQTGRSRIRSDYAEARKRRMKLNLITLTL